VGAVTTRPFSVKKRRKKKRETKLSEASIRKRIMKGHSTSTRVFFVNRDGEAGQPIQERESGKVLPFSARLGHRSCLALNRVRTNGLGGIFSVQPKMNQANNLLFFVSPGTFP